MLADQYTNNQFFEIVQVISCAAMVLSVCNVTRISEYMIIEAQSGIQMSAEYDKFKFWLETEIVVFAAGLVANIIYLFIRSFVIQKITLKVKNMKTDINTDYLEAQSFMVSIFLTFVVPMCVFYYI